MTDRDLDAIRRRHSNIPQDGFDLEALMEGARVPCRPELGDDCPGDAHFYERTWRDVDGVLRHERVKTDE